MGDVTSIMITGAAGFVGRACVAEARRRKVPVVAVLRGTAPDGWAADDGIEVLRVDLSEPASVDVLHAAMPAEGAVIHAAAHLGGDPARHERDTIAATEHLLSASGRARLVLVSSIAVYDTMRLNPGDALTEATPLEPVDHPRDAYTGAKLLQEEVFSRMGLPLWILRPGAVYGPGRTWHALSGFWAGKLHVQIGSGGELPLVHVDHLARTLVDAALTDPGGVQMLNVVDDDRPTRSRFLRAHRRVAGWPRASVTLPYGLWRGLSRLSGPLGERRPGLMQHPILRARLMPLRYPNDALRAALGGTDAAPFEEMLARSIRAEGS